MLHILNKWACWRGDMRRPWLMLMDYFAPARSQQGPGPGVNKALWEYQNSKIPCIHSSPSTSRILGKRRNIFYSFHRLPEGWASPMAQQVKNLLPIQETWEMKIQSLGWEDPLEKEMAPILLPEKSHGQRSLGNSPKSRTQQQLSMNARTKDMLPCLIYFPPFCPTVHWPRLAMRANNDGRFHVSLWPGKIFG